MSDTCMTHIEKHWQLLTVSGNRLFNKGNFEKALSGYKEALYRAEILNNYIADCLRLKIPFIQVYLISCNNLANTYEELGHMEKAEKILKQSVYYLLYLHEKKDVNTDEIESELKKATLRYIRFTRKYNIERANLPYRFYYQP